MTGLTYTSSDPSVATVDQNGVVTGVKIGTATITVSKAGRNYIDTTVQVTVLQREGLINLAVDSGVIVPEGGIEGYYSSYGGNTKVTYSHHLKKWGLLAR